MKTLFDRPELVVLDDWRAYRADRDGQCAIDFTRYARLPQEEARQRMNETIARLRDHHHWIVNDLRENGTKPGA